MQQRSKDNAATLATSPNATIYERRTDTDGADLLGPYRLTESESWVSLGDPIDCGTHHMLSLVAEGRMQEAEDVLGQLCHEYYFMMCGLPADGLIEGRQTIENEYTGWWMYYQPKQKQPGLWCFAPDYFLALYEVAKKDRYQYLDDTKHIAGHVPRWAA